MNTLKHSKRELILKINVHSNLWSEPSGFFFIFCEVVNWIVPLIFLFDLLLVMYQNETDFYILILCIATLPNSMMSSSSFLITSLGFSAYSISSANSDNFTSFQFGFLLFLLLP